jgi:hypothetical protein
LKRADVINSVSDNCDIVVLKDLPPGPLDDFGFFSVALNDKYMREDNEMSVNLPNK